MNFFPRSDLSKLQATVILHTIIFMKNKPHHENQHEKLNNICENQPNLRTPGNTDFGPYWHSLLRDIPWINGTTVKGGPDNCKSVSDPNQTYMVDTPMDPIHKNRKVRSRPQKWAELGGGQSWAFSRFGTPQGIQIKLFYYKRFSKI